MSARTLMLGKNSRTFCLSLFFAGACGIFSCGCLSAVADDAVKPFLGSWDLDLPGGGAGWLKVTEKDGKIHGDLLWAGGGIGQVKDMKVENGHLVFPHGDQSITAEAKGD